MSVKNRKLKTSRMTLRPMEDAEICALIEKAEDPELKKAYVEMLDGARRDPDNALWYVPWAMTLNKNGEIIGSLSFKGPAKDDAVEIGYGIRPEYEGKDYTTEAAKSMVNWAFKDRNVYFVEAEAEAGNAASIRVLEKLGMQQYGQGDEGPRYVVAKTNKKWTPIWMCLGTCMGMTIGNSFFGATNTGLWIGLLVGTGLGFYWDNEEKKKLKEAWERRNSRLGSETKA